MQMCHFLSAMEAGGQAVSRSSNTIQRTELFCHSPRNFDVDLHYLRFEQGD